MKVQNSSHAPALLRLSSRLRQLRHERGLTLSHLAAMTQLSEAYLYRLEGGQRSPSLPALLKLAETYSVKASSLLDEAQAQSGVALHEATAKWTGSEESGFGLMNIPNSAPTTYSKSSRLRVLGDAGNYGDRAVESSPEQYIGAALAGCFSMSLASDLRTAGHETSGICTEAMVYLEHGSSTPVISMIKLRCSVEECRIEFDELDAIAQYTRQTCVISRALAAVRITLEISLDGRKALQPASQS